MHMHIMININWTVHVMVIQYNSYLLKISKLTRAATAITGYNNNIITNQLMLPHHKKREKPLTLSSQRRI